MIDIRWIAGRYIVSAKRIESKFEFEWDHLCLKWFTKRIRFTPNRRFDPLEWIKRLRTYSFAHRYGHDYYEFREFVEGDLSIHFVLSVLGVIGEETSPTIISHSICSPMQTHAHTHTHFGSFFFPFFCWSRHTAK